MFDRLITLFIGVVVVLAAAFVAKALLQNPREAEAGYVFPGSSQVYDVQLIQRIDIPDIKAVVPLTQKAEDDVAVFAVNTEDQVFVYRCGYYPLPEEKKGNVVTRNLGN